MDHFYKMTRAIGTDMTPAFGLPRGEGLKDRLKLFHLGCLSTDHHAVTLGKTPDPAARADVD